MLLFLQQTFFVLSTKAEAESDKLWSDKSNVVENDEMKRCDQIPTQQM